MPLLTYEQAAKRVSKDTGTIKRWRRHGLRMTVDDHGRRVVDEAVLLAWWRERMLADPVHQARMLRLGPQTAARMHGRLPAGRASPPSPPSRRRNLPTKGAPAGETPPARLAEAMPRLRAPAQYTTLHEAMRRSVPACRDDDAFTADRVTVDELARLAAVCERCGVLDQCRRFAEAEKPAAGVWAGKAAASYRGAPTSRAGGSDTSHAT